MLPVWDDEPWEPTAPLASDVEADLVVVGLGGSGLAAVLEGLRRGLSVVGIDAGVVAGGAAGRNGGFALAGLADFHHRAVEQLGRELAVAAYRLTLAELDALDADPDSGFRRTGSLRIAADNAELADCAAHLAALRADGLPAEEYEGPEGAGVLVPTDGVIQPLARCRALARRAAGAGARLFEHSPALDVRRGVVRTAGGTVEAAHVVVAVDGGLELLLPELHGRVRTARLQMLATAPTGEVDLPRPVYRRWGYDYWQQRPDGAVVLGGCRDLFANREWGAPAEPTDEVQAALERLLRDVVRVQRAPVVKRWAGRVGFTDDHLPVVEEVRPGVVACGAYSGTGNLVGAIAGRAAVTLALTNSSGGNNRGIARLLPPEGLPDVQTGRTEPAWRPLGPRVTSNSTR